MTDAIYNIDIEKERKRQYKREWRAKNKDKVRESQQFYYRKNRARLLEKSKEYKLRAKAKRINNTTVTA